MPRKPKYTKQDLISAAVSITKQHGLSSVNARTLGEYFGTAPATVFTHFSSVEEIRKSVIEYAYNTYIKHISKERDGVPPFKNFGINYVRFAIEEPRFFQLLFMSKTDFASIEQMLETGESNKAILDMLQEKYHLSFSESEQLYKYMLIFAHGLASYCAMGSCSFSDEEIAEALSVSFKGVLFSLKNPDFNVKNLIKKVE